MKPIQVIAPQAYTTTYTHTSHLLCNCGTIGDVLETPLLGYTKVIGGEQQHLK